MRSALILPISVLSLLGSLPVAAQPLRRAGELPIEVRPTTIVLHSDVLAGLRVFVPAAQVVRVISPRLIVVAEARVLRTPIVRPQLEELLLALPNPADIVVGQVIKLVGSVRTIAGLMQERNGSISLDEIDPILKSRRYRHETLLVAETAQALDGTDLK